MKIAYFSPIPPSVSGVARLTADILPSLACRAEIDLFIDDIHPALIKTKAPCNVFSHLLFPEKYDKRSYDALVFNIGNSEHHYYMLNYLIRYRGIIFLHEDVLHHSLARYYTKSRDYPGYLKALETNYPDDKDTLFDVFRLVSAGLGDDRLYLKYPMSENIIKSSAGMIVMNSYLESSIKSRYPGLPVKRINLPFCDSEDDNSHSIEPRKNSDFVIGIFGMVSHYKRIIPIMNALKGLLCNNSIRLIIVGKSAPGVDIDEYMASNKIRNAHYYGYLPYNELRRHISSCDLVLNLRYPSFGEMSAALITNMGMGKPVIIYDTPQFRDIPDNAVIRLKPSLDEESALSNTVRYYYNNRQKLDVISENARKYVKQNHSASKSADGIIHFIESFANPPARIKEPPAETLYLEEIIDKQLKSLDIPEDRKKHIRSLWNLAGAG